ncbi:MAG: sporulation transcriptional regulator SpoIIID [Clostridia bacterium]|nr:sporulation transcriptional regulator SpoIIID [Clostridia bacterium]
MKDISIEERACELAHYIIDSKDTVRGAAKKYGISKSTVHTDVTLWNGRNKGKYIPESIEIKGVFLSVKNPVVRLGLVIK